MPRPPSIQWYFKQYLGDNDVLKMEWDASGMHAWLLNLSIQEEPPGSIPNDMVAIRRWLRNPSDDVWRRVQPQIFAAWKFRDGRWYNDGMVRACERRDNYRTRYSDAEVRDRYETGTKNAPNLNEHISSNAFEVDVGSKSKESDAQEIYRCYPRKIGRRAGLKAITSAFLRLMAGKESPHDLFRSYDDIKVYLIQRTRMYATSPAGNNGEFTPHPATWFNRSSYLDDESEWSKNGNGNGHEQVSPQIAKLKRSYDTIARGFAADGEEHAGVGVREVREGHDPPGRSQIVARNSRAATVGSD